MDRDALLEPLPGNAQFNGMAPYQRKEIAEVFIGSIIDAIEDEEREPDAWEAQDIAAAISHILAGWYNAALASGEHALTPPEQRAPHQPDFAGDVPSVRRLREALDYVRGAPARNY